MSEGFGLGSGLVSVHHSRLCTLCRFFQNITDFSIVDVSA